MSDPTSTALAFDRLHAIMRRLMAPDGCPWDREQTHQSIRQYFIEETYEACEAIDHQDDDALCEELGDVALQVVFHAELAAKRHAFTLEQVLNHINEKLVRRHPHIFAQTQADTPCAVLKNWEQIKQEERLKKAQDPQMVSAISGVPHSLPGLQRASRLQEKAARVGFDWHITEHVVEKVREEIEEFLERADELGLLQGAAQKGQPDSKLVEEFGDLLFALVNLSRFLNLHAEEAIGVACEKFSRRFRAIEQIAQRQGTHLKDLSLEQMDVLWEQVKHREKTHSHNPSS